MSGHWRFGALLYGAVTLTAMAPAVAATIEELSQALQIRQVADILAAEGTTYGDTIESNMFPGRGGAGWDGIVQQIYVAETMADKLDQGLEQELAQVDLDPLVRFFASDMGRRIITLELSARDAFRDAQIEEAATEVARDLIAGEGGRYQLLREFIEVNDLIESNVVGALNANMAFYRGMEAGGAFGGEMTENQMLSDVWTEESAIRADTLIWLYAYLGLAYQPLRDDDLRAYIDLSKTPGGQALNRALFVAYDHMYNDISFRMGQMTAVFMSGDAL
ncbi:DUF2059 domain-containing protein [Candidatus Halocynthiibacter alkanivorans]|uniref:DUF2059 domain-containing protein n=1 Tax=Candidatus Halocynthiibacter alkanivorans TaxID=2267619 RepID=UPI000DF1E2AF|nr:DUF2059 domain-containing protein [Candidatus Halocynthiibacter alkanivorans]